MLLPILLILIMGVEAEVEETLYIDHTLAVSYLSDCLRIDEAYEEGILETVSFRIEWPDEPADSTVRDYTDITIWELSDSGVSVVEDSTPLLDRFRVYTNGRILYFSPIPGFYIPYEDFLRGITEI